MTGDENRIASTADFSMRLICAKHGLYGDGTCHFCELDDLRARVEELDGRMPAVFDEIRAERDRQDSKWGEQNHIAPIWLAILSEEVGEVSSAILTGVLAGTDTSALREELIQAAAVAVAWLECIDRRMS